MSSEKTGVRLEVGHVLFIDIVGYSKLLITEQSELLGKLTAAVTQTQQFQMADAEGKLIPLPTGDGMALISRLYSIGNLDRGRDLRIVSSKYVSRVFLRHQKIRLKVRCARSSAPGRPG